MLDIPVAEVSLAALIIAILALGLALFLLRRLSKLEAARRRLLASGDGSLEALLEANLTGVAEASTRLDTLEAQTAELGRRQQRDLQQVGVVRFNPYQDTGGDQSFSIALLDAYQDGVVISGLYSRQGVRLYAKPISAGQSAYPLSDEEKQAIAIAQRPRETAKV